MLDLASLLASLKRPRLLVRAARHGLGDYRRKIHLPRILGGTAPERPAQVALVLMDMEEQMNIERKTRDANYSAARHVMVLIALMHEAQVLAEAKLRPVP